MKVPDSFYVTCWADRESCVENDSKARNIMTNPGRVLERRTVDCRRTSPAGSHLGTHYWTQSQRSWYSDQRPIGDFQPTHSIQQEILSLHTVSSRRFSAYKQCPTGDSQPTHSIQQEILSLHIASIKRFSAYIQCPAGDSQPTHSIQQEILHLHAALQCQRSKD